MYLSPVGPTGSQVPVSELIPSDLGALYLQRQYSVETVDADTGDPVSATTTEPGTHEQTVQVRTDPGQLDDAGDGSDWSAEHALYHHQPGSQSCAC